MKLKTTDVASVLLINVIIVLLFVKFLLSYFGFTGLVIAYAISVCVCIYIYILRNKAYLIDVTLGLAGIIGMIYSVMIKKNWPLFAMELSVIVIVFSVSSFYFDWKKLDQR